MSNSTSFTTPADVPDPAKLKGRMQAIALCLDAAVEHAVEAWKDKADPPKGAHHTTIRAFYPRAIEVEGKRVFVLCLVEVLDPKEFHVEFSKTLYEIGMTATMSGAALTLGKDKEV